MITSIQKIIKVGSSDGVTLPKKALKSLGAKRGDELKITAELVKNKQVPGDKELMKEYDAFVSKYGQTLKNLSDR